MLEGESDCCCRAGLPVPERWQWERGDRIAFKPGRRKCERLWTSGNRIQKQIRTVLLDVLRECCRVMSAVRSVVVLLLSVCCRIVGEPYGRYVCRCM
jgi:hypothetical protein